MENEQNTNKVEEVKTTNVEKPQTINAQIKEQTVAQSMNNPISNNSLKDCLERNDVTKKLDNFVEKFATIEEIVLIMAIIGGIVIIVFSSIAFDFYGYPEFNTFVFFISLIMVAFSLLIIKLVMTVIKLLIEATADNTYSNSCTTRISAYLASKEEKSKK